MAERYKVELGQAIQRRRLELGMTQDDLAKATHYKNGQAVSRWERGANLPSNLDVVAEALGFTLAELVEGIIPPNRRVARKLGIVTNSGTPDLSNSQPSQLDRIEAQLTQLQVALDRERAAAIVRDAATIQRIAEAEEAIRRLLPSPRRAGRA